MFDDRPSLHSMADRRVTLPEGQAWYLAQLKPNSLEIARRNLMRQGFPLFVPQRVETRRMGGRFRTGPFPLFPGYLFIALDPAEGRWRAVNGTKGVTRLVAFGGRPAAVPQGLVAEIARACDTDEGPAPEAPVQPGDAMRIAGGPFAGFLAQVLQAEPDRRVWVLIDLMGQQTRIEVPRAALRRA